MKLTKFYNNGKFDPMHWFLLRLALKLIIWGNKLHSYINREYL